MEGILTHTKAFRWKDFPVPPGIHPIKGGTHIAVSRNFVEFVLFDDMSRSLQDWLRPTWVPDETFFATINHNPQLCVKGSFLKLSEVEEQMGRKPSFVRYKMWVGEGECAWHYLRGICLLSVGDLPRLTQSPFLIANKFFLQDDWLVVGCLEEWLANKTLDMYLGQHGHGGGGQGHVSRSLIDTSVYEKSVIVSNRLTECEADIGGNWRQQMKGG